jgi:Trk-type K+ transport system membrane component
MPAGSERSPAPAPSLPHTWRPLGVRIAVWTLGLMLFALCAAVWIGIGDKTRDQFTTFQRGTLVFIAVLLAATWYALVRSKVTATSESLTVVNGYRKRVFEWSQVISVSLRRGAPWGTLDLSDGTTVSMIGVQGSDGERARRAIREIRAAIAANTPEIP